MVGDRVYEPRPFRFLTGRRVKNVPDPQPFERALQVLAGTPGVLATLVTISQENQASDSQVGANAWSPRQILAHLLVVERDINPPRLRRLAEVDGMAIEPTGESLAPNADVESLLQAWARERARNLAWLRTLAPATRAHVSIHPQHGRITLDQHLVEWAYHDLDHLRQMLGVLGADLYPHMGSWQTLYGPPG
jgi:DinB family protein